MLLIWEWRLINKHLMLQFLTLSTAIQIRIYSYYLYNFALLQWYFVFELLLKNNMQSKPHQIFKLKIVNVRRKLFLSSINIHFWRGMFLFVPKLVKRNCFKCKRNLIWFISWSVSCIVINKYSQWMIKDVSVSNSSFKAGCSAMHLIFPLLSSLDIGKLRRDIEVQVLSLADALRLSWLWPLGISSTEESGLIINHLSWAGGFAPVEIHSNSRSSPAAATWTSWLFPSPRSPTRWTTISVGLSEILWNVFI